MLNRLRANIRFTKSSGLATWSRDQLNVRYGQAVHINEGLANEELAINEILPDNTSTDHEVYKCDIPLSDYANAKDAFDTITAASVFHETHVSGFPGEVEGEVTSSWVELHECDHNESERSGCSTLEITRIP